MKIYSIYRNNEKYDWLSNYQNEGHETALISSSAVQHQSEYALFEGNVYQILSKTHDKSILTDNYYDLNSLQFDNQIIVKKTLNFDKRLLVNPLVNIGTQVYFYEYFKDLNIYDVTFVYAPQIFWQQVARIQAKWFISDFIENKQFYHELLCNFAIHFYKHQIKVLES